MIEIRRARIWIDMIGIVYNGIKIFDKHVSADYQAINIGKSIYLSNGL